MLLGNKYELVSIDKNDNDEKFGVRIIDGFYRGVVIEFKKFEVIDFNEEEETCEMSYDYDIRDVPQRLTEHELSEEEVEQFNNIVREMFLDILENFDKDIQQNGVVCD